MQGTQGQRCAPIRNLSVLLIEVQLQLVRYDGLAGEILHLRAWGRPDRVPRRADKAPRRAGRAPRRLLNGAAAYADFALAGAASPPFHPQAFTDCAKAGAANAMANATAAISVFMVSLHQDEFTMSGFAHLLSRSNR